MDADTFSGPPRSTFEKFGEFVDINLFAVLQAVHQVSSSLFLMGVLF
jgi:hypothetical protein